MVDKAMTKPITTAEEMRDAAATAITHALCDEAEDEILFMQHRDYFAALVLAIPIAVSETDAQRASYVRGEMGMAAADRAETTLMRPRVEAGHRLTVEARTEERCEPLGNPRRSRRGR